MKSKKEILDKYLKDNHGPAETYRDILKAMKDVRDGFENRESRDVALLDFGDGCKGDFGCACEVDLREVEAFAELTNQVKSAVS